MNLIKRLKRNPPSYIEDLQPGDIVYKRRLERSATGQIITYWTQLIVHHINPDPDGICNEVCRCSYEIWCVYLSGDINPQNLCCCEVYTKDMREFASKAGQIDYSSTYK